MSHTYVWNWILQVYALSDKNYTRKILTNTEINILHREKCWEKTRIIR